MRQQQQEPAHVAFGKNYRTGSSSYRSNENHVRVPSARNSLDAKNLSILDKKSGSGVAVKRPVDPEVVVFTGEEAKAAAAGVA